VVYIQALKIAAGFPNVSPLLVSYGFREHIRSVEFGHSHKGRDWMVSILRFGSELLKER
jgi:hypothetical protein